MTYRNVPLDFNTYQSQSLTTDQVKGDGEDALLVPLLGLVGEVGTLATEHKKRVRDKEKHRLFKERIEEDLGDILWYVSNFASKSGLRLEEIARKNLHKVQARWALPAGTQLKLFDDGVNSDEQIPRHFVVDFRIDKKGRVRLHSDGAKLGDPLTDNNYGDDGYRFHDVFHLSYAAVLGWSPVTRALLKCKRKSDPIVDEVEDGGRAAVIEEGVAALAYAHAKTRDFLEGATEIDHNVLEAVRRMTAHLEVRARTPAEWEQAILTGFAVWRELRKANGGLVTVDLLKRKLFYASAPSSAKKKGRSTKVATRSANLPKTAKPVRSEAPKRLARTALPRPSLVRAVNHR
ncbi:nucleoside triphosphate pyrophosphohydrolase family protein [Sorangium sp. So ce1182]|uniref:nucleoside triphosphate pyrophosphohydrolase family protein n=1 Tax=Sorangium sp. So ce1182 TaxID=3133334 RepID=UPI003F5EC9F8